MGPIHTHYALLFKTFKPQDIYIYMWKNISLQRLHLFNKKYSKYSNIKNIIKISNNYVLFEYI